MEQRRRKKRTKKKIIKKILKRVTIVLSVVIVLFLIYTLGFRINSVIVSTDKGNYSNQEVLAYMKDQGITNSLSLLIKNKLGKGQKMELFDGYKVSMISPVKVKIKAYENPFVGYLSGSGKTKYYVDKKGIILKATDTKIKGIPRLTGITKTEFTMYRKVKCDSSKKLNTLVNVASKIEGYGFNVKTIGVNSKCESWMQIKNVIVLFGSESNIDKKLKDFNDMHKNVVKYKGTLNMKYINEEGVYTLKKQKKKAKKSKK